jgi:hypothetical protein
MKLPVQLAGTASIHVAFLVAAYGTHFFGLHLPSAVAIPVWLLASSAIALISHWWVLRKSSFWGAVPYRSGKLAVFAVLATVASLYAGVFIAANTFGV